MPSNAIPNPLPAVPVKTPRATAWLRQAWDRLNLSEDERFLREALDLADLETRLRRLERGPTDRFGPHPPLP